MRVKRVRRERELVNLTGHPLNVCGVTLAPMGQARVKSQMTTAEVITLAYVDVPILDIVEGHIENLPEPRAGVLYIVSGVVAAAARREDVVAPARMSRNREGDVIGCRALARPRPM